MQGKLTGNVQNRWSRDARAIIALSISDDEKLKLLKNLNFEILHPESVSLSTLDNFADETKLLPDGPISITSLN